MSETILKNTDARVIALADMFQDRLDTAKQFVDKLSAAKGHAGIEKTFLGPKAYQQIAESKDVDAVVIATPPYYHVEHLAAIVAAGKHVYCEKPVAVDVPGAKRVLEIGQRAEGKTEPGCGLPDPHGDALHRTGEAGCMPERWARSVTGAAHYYCNALELNFSNLPPAMLRLRNWVQDRTLSGDIIVEQNIHAIDICNWILQGRTR